MRNKSFALIMGLSAVILSISILIPDVGQAAVQDWQKGANVTPPYTNNTTDFDTETFRVSLRNLANTKANYVSLVVPYYQANINSSDIYRGYNTPTDESLVSAIEYAHSLNLKVMLKFFLEPQDGQWRAYINPNDRTTWFNNYGAYLTKYGLLAQKYNVEAFTIGTELVSTTNPNVNPNNTQSWIDLISKTRAVYSGPLTYGAHWGTPFDEKNLLGFWSQLDYIGLSAYFPLSQDNNPSVDTLKAAWSNWNTTQIKPLYEKYNKPILLTEVGYKSTNGTFTDPGNWQSSGSPNQSAQANGYEAVLSYFNDYSYIKGIYFWDWKSDPNAGGPNDSDYTPQNKIAQNVMTSWFKSSTSFTPATYTASASISPNPAIVNQLTTITAGVKNTSLSSDGTNLIIDVELYNAQNQKVYQKFFDYQNLSANTTKSYSLDWTPPTTENYTVKVGVFNNNWSQNYLWNGNVLTFSPANTPAPVTPPSPAPTPTPTPMPTPEPAPVQDNRAVDIWWPSNGSSVLGVQLFKALTTNMALNQYKMYWQVDGGSLNLMNDSFQDYPHKEVLVDVSGWKWRGNGPYIINFVSKDLNGNIISQKSTSISVK